MLVCERRYEDGRRREGWVKGSLQIRNFDKTSPAGKKPSKLKEKTLTLEINSRIL